MLSLAKDLSPLLPHWEAITSAVGDLTTTSDLPTERGGQITWASLGQVSPETVVPVKRPEELVQQSNPGQRR